MNIWADYSAGRPSGAALKAAGITGVIRYVGIGSASKRLTAAELADLRAHGITVYGVAESTANRADVGFNAGVADAHAVLADPVTATLPLVFATNDQPSYSAADVDYVRGFSSVLGVARTGAYGFASFLTAVRHAGYAVAFWQAGEPPNMTGTASFVHLWQRQGTTGNGTSGLATPTSAVIDGVMCDINNQLVVLEASGVTTLDDTFRSLYHNADDVQSTVELSYASVLQYLDSRVCFIYENLVGEQRFPMPDGVKRNVFDVLGDVTARLIALEAKVDALHAATLEGTTITAPVTLTGTITGTVAG